MTLARVVLFFQLLISVQVVDTLKLVTGPASGPGYRPVLGSGYRPATGPGYGPAVGMASKTGPAYQPHGGMINGEVVASPEKFLFAALLKKDISSNPRCGGTLVAK